MKNLFCKRNVLSLLVALLAVVTLASCSKGVDMGKYIPNDAVMVFDVDMDELWDKADLDNIDQISFVKLGRQELRSENPWAADLVDAILKDPTSTGLNLKRDIAAYFCYNSDIDGAVIATMHNKKKFEEFLNDFAKQNELTVKFEDKDGWRLATMVSEFNVENYVAFNGDVAMLLFSGNCMDKRLTLKKDESLASDKRFREYWKNRSELSMWMGMKELMSIAGQNGEDVQGMLSQIYGEEYWKAIENASIAGNVVFEKGVMRMVFTYQGISSKIIDKYMQKFEGDLVDYMPEKTYAAIALAYNLKETMKVLEANEEFDINLDEEAMEGVTVRDAVSAFGGSMLFSLFDLQVDNGSVMPMMALALDIKDADIVKKLLAEAGLTAVEENVYSLEGFFNFPIYVALNKKAVFVTNSDAALEGFKKGGNKNAMKNVAKSVKAGNYIYADLDINHYPDGVKSLIPENIVVLMSKYFDYTEIKVNGTKSGEWDLYIKDKKQNSLLSTLHFVDDNLVELGNLAGSIGGGSDYDDVTDTIYVDEDWGFEDED
ncbi:MAG: DUF4836 family protein [Bacteroidales bacterium]|nr:DUF4836 family protein [Bacteroidales bacterium]